MLLLRKYLIVTGHSEGFIKLWDLLTNECIQVLSGHEGEVTSIVLLNHELFASASYDGKIILWRKTSDIAQNLANLNEILDEQTAHLDFTTYFRKIIEIHADQGSLKCLCSVNWDKIASGGDGSDIHLWAIRDNSLNFIQSLQGHQGSIKCLIYLNDGCLASGSEDNSIRLWKVTDFTCKLILNEHEDWVNCFLHLGINGLFASANQDKTIKMWSCNDEKSKYTIECTESIKSLKDVGNEVIAGGDKDGNINLWSFNEYQLLNTFAAHNSRVSSLQVMFIECKEI